MPELEDVLVLLLSLSFTWVMCHHRVKPAVVGVTSFELFVVTTNSVYRLSDTFHPYSSKVASIFANLKEEDGGRENRLSRHRARGRHLLHAGFVPLMASSPSGGSALTLARPVLL